MKENMVISNELVLTGEESEGGAASGMIIYH